MKKPVWVPGFALGGRSQRVIPVDAPTVLGKYRLLRRIGGGGMGEVFLARVAGPAGFEKTMVVKRPLAAYAGLPRFVEMFLNEARLAAQLTHPNVVQIFELAEIEGTYLIVMEYVEGLSLRALLRARRMGLIEIPPTLATAICVQVLHGLSYAHELRDDSGRVRGVVHRDVSPENVLLGFNGAVKVADFGLARAAEASIDKVPMGKAGYMPPEQQQGKLLDARADLYAVGVVLLELLRGQPLYALDRGPAQYPDDLPLQTVLRRALAPRADDRFICASDMARELDAVLRKAGEEVGPARIGAVVRIAALKLGSTGSGERSPGDSALTQPLPRPSELDVPSADSADVVELGGPDLFRRTKSLPEALESPLPGTPVAPPLLATGFSLSDAKAVRRSRWPWAVGTLVLTAALVVGVAAAPRGSPPDALPGVARAAPASPVAPPVAAEAPVEEALPLATSLPSDRPAAPSATASPARPAVHRGARPVVAAGKGRLAIRVHPWAEVQIDAQPYGTTPLAPIELPAGRHAVQLRNPELNVSRTVWVTVAAGGETSVFEDLLKSTR